jgi:lipoate-protein ligase B
VPDLSCAVRRLGLVEYEEAWAMQRHLVETCRQTGEQHLLLLEHPPTYTLGARGNQENLLLSENALAAIGATVHRIDRGGDITYHGPGQLVGYPILDLRRWGQGPLWYVRSLEAALIETLSRLGVRGERRPGKPGVWLGTAKIAAIGVHVSRGVTSHGFALNVDPDLSYFSHIVPCGLPDITVTSIADQGDQMVAPTRTPGEQSAAGTVAATPSMDEVMDTVVDSFAQVFEMEMRDGARTVAPRAWAPAAAL